MSKAPAFQLYAADFYMDTVGWSCEEVGLYFRLLMAEWVNGPLPDDPTRLAKTCQMSLKKFQVNFNLLVPKFVKNEGGFLINIRLEKTREKQMQYIESQREKGKIRADKRWEGHVATAIIRLQPDDKPKHASSSSSSIKNKHIEISLPEWIKKPAWESYLEMRKSISAKPTPHAIELIISKLDGLRKAGQDPNAILDQSTMNNWKGVFAIKEAGNGRTDFRRAGTDYEKTGRGKDGGAGGCGIPKEYKPEAPPDISEGERQRNLQKLHELIN